MLNIQQDDILYSTFERVLCRELIELVTSPSITKIEEQQQHKQEYHINTTTTSLLPQLVHLITECTFNINQISRLISRCPGIRILQVTVSPPYIHEETGEDFDFVEILDQCPTLYYLNFNFFSDKEYIPLPIAREQVVGIINHQTQSSSGGLQQFQLTYNNDRAPNATTLLLPLLQKTKDTSNFLAIDQSIMTQYFYTDRWNDLALIGFPCLHKLRMDMKTINGSTLCQFLDMHRNVL